MIRFFRTHRLPIPQTSEKTPPCPHRSCLQEKGVAANQMSTRPIQCRRCLQPNISCAPILWLTWSCLMRWATRNFGMILLQDTCICEDLPRFPLGNPVILVCWKTESHLTAFDFCRTPSKQDSEEAHSRKMSQTFPSFPSSPQTSESESVLDGSKGVQNEASSKIKSDSSASKSGAVNYAKRRSRSSDSCSEAVYVC